MEQRRDPVSGSSIRGAGPTADIYRPVSGWLERPDDIQPRLEGTVSADAIVVGGGFAGLSTALELKARGADVIVIEREFAGYGASGRNAGYLAGGQGLDFGLFLKRVGREQASRIVAFYQDGVSYVERKFEEYGIDCDYNPSGLIRAGIHPSHEAKIRAQLETCVGLGASARFLDHDAMRARGIPPAFLFGYLTGNGGTLDPGKYVMGLRRAALQAGVRIYENSALRSYTEGKRVVCETGHGRAEAPFLVLATNAYTPQLGLLKDKVAPLRVSAIETQPLSPAQLKALGWPHREGIVTQHNVMEALRLTARNSLVLTTKRLHYVYGGKTPNVPDEATYRALVVALGDRFPALRDQPIKACWSGFVSFAYDGLPVIGETGDADNVFHTAGCAGHGLGSQSFVGLLLADKISGVENPHLSALRHKTPTALPEPLQWVFMKTMLGAAHLADDHINRKVRKAAR